MAITNRLKELRTASGKTQDEVIAELTRQEGERPFSRGMLSHYERGAQQPVGEALDVLCRYYRVQPGEILVWEPDRRAYAPA